MPERKQKEFNMYVRLELAGTLNCPTLWEGDEHRHAFFEMIYTERGSCVVSAYGEKIVLNAHDVVLIQPLEPHALKTVQENTRIVYVGFQCEKGENPLYDGTNTSDMKNFESSATLVRMLQNTNVEDLLLNEADILAGILPISKWIVEKCMINGSKSDSQNMLCRKTIKYLKMNMNRFVTVEEIASSLYVVPHYLGIVFAKTMGNTILQYQQSLKMEQAASLIRTGELDIKEVSDQLGFSSPQYFSKCFKTYFGITPSQAKRK